MALPSLASAVATRCVSPIRGSSPTRIINKICADTAKRLLSPVRNGSPERTICTMRTGSPERMLSPNRNMVAQQRLLSDCRGYPDPPCPPLINKDHSKTCPGAQTTPGCGQRFAQSPCVQTVKKKMFKSKPPPFKTMWKIPPECCNARCPDLFPRLDSMYYKPSDKLRRKYMQTWKECPEMLILPRKVCCYELLDNQVLPRERRKKKHIPKTACSQGSDLHLKCDKIGGKYTRCKKIRMPGCIGARLNPSCKLTRYPLNCKKICTPYPSFSECSRKRPKPKPKKECRCLDEPSMCEVYAEMHRLNKMKGGRGSCC